VNEEDGLDTTIIEGLIAEIGPESMARVLDAMAGDSERLMNGLQSALAANDAKAFGLFAHSLKSNSLTVGATAAAALFDELEMLGPGDPSTDFTAKVGHAIAAYRELIGFIVTVPDCEQTRLTSNG
jgi:HPt (histidine-containing phosphotransfer) domain-containing protein